MEGAGGVQPWAAAGWGGGPTRCNRPLGRHALLGTAPPKPPNLLEVSQRPPRRTLPATHPRPPPTTSSGRQLVAEDVINGSAKLVPGFFAEPQDHWLKKVSAWLGLAALSIPPMTRV
jgi:hypothetical protein